MTDQMSLFDARRPVVRRTRVETTEVFEAPSAASPPVKDGVIVPFDFEGAAVRVIWQGDCPWWVLADVCRVLDVAEPHRAASRLDDDEKGRHTVTTPGGPQNTVIINESGLFSLILTSRKVEAKRFKKWVTAEVLPTLRRTGRYEMPTATEERAITAQIGADQMGLVRRNVAGVVSGVVNREVARAVSEAFGPVLAIMRRHGIAIPPEQWREIYAPMRTLLDEINVAPAGNVRRCSARARRWCERHWPGGARVEDVSGIGRRYFHRDAFAAWWATEGAQIVMRAAR